MTNKLVVIINSFKEPKIKKILLYEMKFLVPIFSCLQNPWLRGLPPPDPLSLCPLSSTEFVDPLRTKFLGTPLSTLYRGHVCLSLTYQRPNFWDRFCVLICYKSLSVKNCLAVRIVCILTGLHEAINCLPCRPASPQTISRSLVIRRGILLPLGTIRYTNFEVCFRKLKEGRW